jgi:D-glycero-D-manno-heptose 1,7-bisphosphate phosphatase
MKALFLDRDGVINENLPTHVTSWAEFQFIPRALDALRLLGDMEYRIIVITNQAIINRGIVARATVDEINARMVDEVHRQGGRIDAVLYCPHRADEACACRKPMPGMVLHAATRWGLDLTQSVLIGDALTDMGVGLAVGCQSILVRTGRGRQQLAMQGGAPRTFRVTRDLMSAARWIQWTTERAGRDTAPPALVGTSAAGAVA